MWIGVISDTHGSVSDNVIDILDGVDYILHCGNIGNPAVIEELSQVAPISGVIGQSDDDDQYPFKKTLFKKWFDVGIYVTHRLGDPARLSRNMNDEIERHDPQVVLFGHMQGAFNNRVEDRLFFNPGPSGKRRGKHPRSVGILELRGYLVRGEVVPLDGA